jgi:hypothetical protein
MHVDCAVTEETPQPGGTTTQTAIPACSMTAGTPPCWKVSVDAACSNQSPQSLSLDVLFPPSSGLPSDSYLDATCATTPT